MLGIKELYILCKKWYQFKATAGNVLIIEIVNFETKIISYACACTLFSKTWIRLINPIKNTIVQLGIR